MQTFSLKFEYKGTIWRFMSICKSIIKVDVQLVVLEDMGLIEMNQYTIEFAGTLKNSDKIFIKT
jgi:hypothetical protein